MKEPVIIGLLQNVSIVLVFAMLYENAWMKNEELKTLWAKILAGTVLGGIVIVLMFTPWIWIPGINFDARSVVLSVSGLFFGPIPTFMAMALAGLVRVFQGGDGLRMGLGVIISSGLIGLWWRRFRPFWKQNYLRELFTMGIAVHLAMLAMTSLLPSEMAWRTFTIIIPPIALIYIPATVLLGVLMVKQSNHWQNRLAGEKLRESEKRLIQILKSSNIVSVVLDPSGNIVFFNRFLTDIALYTKDELSGKNWIHEFIPESYREEVKKRVEEEMAGISSGDQYETKLLAKNGDVFYIAWHNTRLQNEKHEVSGIAIIGVDITERRKYEMMLRVKNKKIEAQNKKYRHLNEELHRAKEKAEESDHLKSAFLANLSHEIRTPMNAILGFSDLLRQADLSSEKRESFSDIIQSRGHHLLAIIDDIVEISKIDAGQISLHPVFFPIHDFFEELYQSMSIMLPKEKELELKMVTTNSDISLIIHADQVKLNQIMTNLITNAFKFTEKGIISFGYIVLSNREVKFFVKDTGIGIAPKYHTAIFERFRQIEVNPEVRKGGSGLGLAISKAYVEMMGGAFTLSSEPGKGSVFSFTIPCI